MLCEGIPLLFYTTSGPVTPTGMSHGTRRLGQCPVCRVSRVSPVCPATVTDRAHSPITVRAGACAVTGQLLKKTLGLALCSLGHTGLRRAGWLYAPLATLG